MTASGIQSQKTLGGMLIPAFASRDEVDGLLAERDGREGDADRLGRHLHVDEADELRVRGRLGLGLGHVRAVEVDGVGHVVALDLDALVVELVVVHHLDGAVARLHDARGRRVQRRSPGQRRGVSRVLQLGVHDVEVAEIDAQTDGEEKGQHPEGADREDRTAFFLIPVHA